ncbi:hypothetical protein TRAPUB_11346 [Trametes pubescens]|uniref:DUF7770 domain-containing protein n=1 Tax=Trametes pubescens TaxID=154538 RepID=A0A1M2VWZ6_TRAPU|nr:hypothetical protein TRAPUB_11346 [Trametes pubescens]
MSSSNHIYDRPLRSIDRQRRVTEILVIASGTINTTVNEPNVFHWQLYLLLEPDDPMSESATSSQSVLMDMIPTDPPTGTLYLASPAARGLDADPKVELAIATAGSGAPPTVQDLIDLFVAKGMDRYKFDDSGSGCLHWLMTGIQHLEDAGLVEPGASESLRTFHREQVKQHPERHPMPIRRGIFYCYETKRPYLPTAEDVPCPAHGDILEPLRVVSSELPVDEPNAAVITKEDVPWVDVEMREHKRRRGVEGHRVICRGIVPDAAIDLELVHEPVDASNIRDGDGGILAHETHGQDFRVVQITDPHHSVGRDATHFHLV